MLFGLGKKKIKNEEEESGVKINQREPEEGESRRGKKVKEKGSRWTAMVLLGLSVTLGIFFWIFGILSGGDQTMVERNADSGRNEIIFEKKPTTDKETETKRSGFEESEQVF